MADVGRKRALDGDGPATVRKKLRPSELPLSQAKRAAIDGLVHMFQKKGTYDDIRRDLMKQYVSGPAKDELQAALKDLVERETDRNPSLLSKDPRMATTLIEGAGERSDIYGNIMNTVNTLLDRLIQEQGLPKMREYRIQEIGAEAAAEEEKRGSKTEEEWAQEAEARRERREARQREEREKEDEERRRKDRERIDKEREEERLRLKKEREEHEKSREARLKKIREEDAERERRIQEELDRDRGGRRRGGRGRSRTPELDDDLALQLLLQESEQMKKSRQRPVLERSESLEPPMRKAQPPKSLVPRDPATTRLAKLESKSTSPAHGSPSKDSKTPAPKTPTALAKDDDTAMTDAPSIEKSRWDYPPELPSKLDKSRGRSRSRSVARILRHLEKNGVAIVRARGHEGDGASANAAAAILALGVPTTLIAMYQVVALQPLVPPVNARTVEIVSVRTVGRLGNVTTAVTVHEATVHETTTVGMAVENEEVDV
ncbi:COMPASS-Shg1 multi-domain protein [Pyrenophora tritici-repentis]|uniref:COMPASS-Shg1 multi-domain protein n=1 Tax=Pyrenophora tritici-repentis TaxID=45151 RepID=A0A834RVN7_9PLEO|nr:COMPASS-Shg1 multi-domain protein [Pyrenophora tritici-repentis]